MKEWEFYFRGDQFQDIIFVLETGPQYFFEDKEKDWVFFYEFSWDNDNLWRKSVFEKHLGQRVQKL